MRAELVMIGTELLLGEIVDSNAVFLARKLAECGVDLFHKSTVGDNFQRAQKVLRHSLSRSDLIIISGGLGPTTDDLTRELVSVVTGRELQEDPQVLATLVAWFKNRYGNERVMPVLNNKQAYFPKGSEVLLNPVGTAPGFWLKNENKIIVALPGVPHELRAIFLDSVEPKLQILAGKDRLVTKNLNFAGIGESHLQELLVDLIDSQNNPTIALYASGGKVRVRLGAKAPSYQGAELLIRPVEREIIRRTKGYFYGVDEQTLEEVVGTKLKDKGLTLALAESCTGGLVSHLLTNIPGSSAYFLRGYIVYSNCAKVADLGVPREIINTYGAVSAETAQAMAEGVRRQAKSDFGLAITGIAGPGGGTPKKPVGLVYICLASLGDTIVQRYEWRGTREQIKNRSALAALHLLWQSSLLH